MARLGRISKWTWVQEGGAVLQSERTWKLISPSGKTAATVWANGTWHTWDRNDVGGENDVEDTVAEAKRQAFAAVAIQGDHEIQIGE